MYKSFYRMPRLKNHRGIMIAECYLLIQEFYFFSLFFFACTKKKQKSVPIFIGTMIYSPLLRSAVVQSGEWHLFLDAGTLLTHALFNEALTVHSILSF